MTLNFELLDIIYGTTPLLDAHLYICLEEIDSVFLFK